MTVTSANLGYPRIGAGRELKRALENYWSKKIAVSELLEAGKELRATHWKIQKEAGIDVIPSNDFSFYDQVLDTTCMVGAIPERYHVLKDLNFFDLYFAMARGIQNEQFNLHAMEMTKWFDTNYHYIVSEIEENQNFHLANTKIIDEFVEAKNLGVHTRPVLLGPVSYLLLSKSTSQSSPLNALSKLLPIYVEVLKKLSEAGADWVQIDEPCLVTDLSEEAKKAYALAYAELSQVKNVQVMLTTYFGGLDDNLSLMTKLPVAGVHVDLVRAPQGLDQVLEKISENQILSVGVIDGRNIWRADVDKILPQIEKAISKLGSARIQIAPSCSLLFSPHDLQLETKLDSELMSWLAFAKQKLDEIVLLKKLSNNETGTTEALSQNRAAIESRKNSAQTNNPEVRQRLASIKESMLQRNHDYKIRKEKQNQKHKLPLLPTTTIGSFPQTAEVRAKRAAKNKGTLNQKDYETFLKAETERTIRLQEEIGLDVLVHGEFERTDMVEYFGEQLTGIAFTQHGWVQSYGSRCVRPPIIFGDVTRPNPMTVPWSVYAQSLTKKPVKGMLTGPVTILEWSFVRDDQPRSVTCQQLAFAIRDEVIDLEKAGINIIQIDEPALREGLPLRKKEHASYLTWAVDSFRLASSGVTDETQIHTHMCYAEFDEIIESIARMDADVISIEASRSKMELLDTFKKFQYPNDVGPGMYDIHSPSVPSQNEIEELIEIARKVVPLNQLWINPDCGLKTRRWDEVIPALKNMVNAVQAIRGKQA